MHVAQCCTLFGRRCIATLRSAPRPSTPQLMSVVRVDGHFVLTMLAFDFPPLATCLQVMSVVKSLAEHGITVWWYGVMVRWYAACLPGGG